MKRFIFLFVTVFAYYSVFAQNFIKSLAQEITNQAISGSVVLVRQSYYLVDKTTGEAYGRNNRDEFGSNVSLGVLTTAGVLLTDEAANPWNYEKNFDFKQYEKDYAPEIIKTEIKNIDDDRSSFSVQSSAMKPDEMNGVLLGKIETGNSSKLEIDVEPGKKDGWIVWFLNDGSSDDIESQHISMESYTASLDITKKKDVYEINQPIDSARVVGGIYLNLQFLGGGHVVYKLAGYMIRQDGKWAVRKMPLINKEKEIKSDEGVSLDITDGGNGGDTIFTPVKKPKDDAQDVAEPSKISPKDKPKKKRK